MNVYSSLRNSDGWDKTSEILVVLCFCSKDSHLMIKMVQWMVDMNMPKTHDCLLSYDVDVPSNHTEAISKTAHEVFNEVRSFRYDKAPVTRWPEGPNHAFQKTAKYIHQYINQPWLWLEFDEIPLIPDWLIKLQDEYDLCGMPFMGHILYHMGHMNGGGIYPHNFPEISPRAMQCTRTAWDAEMRFDMINQCCPANDIIEQRPHISFNTIQDVKTYVRPGMLLYHQSKDGTLIDRLREMLV